MSLSHNNFECASFFYCYCCLVSREHKFIALRGAAGREEGERGREAGHVDGTQRIFSYIYFCCCCAQQVSSGSGRRRQQQLAPCATSHGRHLPARALLRCPLSHSHSLSLMTVRGILIKCKQRISSGRGSSSSAGFARDFLARLNLLIKERATVEGGGGEGGGGNWPCHVPKA